MALLTSEGTHETSSLLPLQAASALKVEVAAASKAEAKAEVAQKAESQAQT